MSDDNPYWSNDPDSHELYEDAPRSLAVSSFAAPTGAAASVKYNLDTRIFKNGIVEMELRNATEILARWVMNTRDEATRKALIALGWTPPPNESR